MYTQRTRIHHQLAQVKMIQSNSQNYSQIFSIALLSLQIPFKNRKESMIWIIWKKMLYICCFAQRTILLIWEELIFRVIQYDNALSIRSSVKQLLEHNIEIQKKEIAVTTGCESPKGSKLNRKYWYYCASLPRRKSSSLCISSSDQLQNMIFHSYSLLLHRSIDLIFLY